MKCLGVLLLVVASVSCDRDDVQITVKHAPNRMHCSAGWQFDPQFFHERDGSVQGACVKLGRMGATDRLNPGERFGIMLEVPEGKRLD